MPTAFEDMDEAAPDPYWAVLGDEGHVIENQDEGVVDERNGPLVGLLTRVQDDVGANDSRLYTVRIAGVDRPVKIWGKAHIDSQVDDAGIEPGDEIGIRKTGEEIDVGEDSAMQEFEVRVSKA